MNRWLQISQALLEDIAKEKPEELRRIGMNLMKKLDDEDEVGKEPTPEIIPKAKNKRTPNIVAGIEFKTMQEAADHLSLHIDKYKYLKRYAVQKGFDDIYDYLLTRNDADDILGSFTPKREEDDKQDALDAINGPSSRSNSSVLRRRVGE